MPTPINLSASRAAALLGQSEYQTPVQVWLQIMESREPGFCARRGYTLPVVEYTPAMRWGHAFESAIVELASAARGATITDRERFFATSGAGEYSRTPELSLERGHFLTCHIDGLYIGDDPPSLHEGKTTSEFYYNTHFGEPGTDRVPVEYQVQCQHQLMCTGAEKVILSVLVFPRRVDDWDEMGCTPKFIDPDRWRIEMPDGWRDPIEWANTLAEMGYFHQYEITAHPMAQSLMLYHYREFWENHVLTGTPPPVRAYDDIKKLFREPVGTIIATDEIERLMIEYRLTLAEVGDAKKNNDAVKTKVLDWMSAAGAVPDDESADKWILRSSTGEKLASYYKDKNGRLVFR